MNKIIEDRREELKVILDQHRIKEAYLFGSVVGENFRESSDIDLVIKFDNIPFEGYAENLWDLEDKLEMLFQRKVDVIPDHTLKNPFFINEVERTKVKIYG